MTVFLINYNFSQNFWLKDIKRNKFIYIVNRNKNERRISWSINFLYKKYTKIGWLSLKQRASKNTRESSKHSSNDDV